MDAVKKPTANPANRHMTEIMMIALFRFFRIRMPLCGQGGPGMVPHLDATGIGRVTLPDKRESLNKIVAYRCIFFEDRRPPLFCDDPPVSVV